jgi:hypothetical protein
MTPFKEIRNAVKTKFQATKDAAGFTINDFDLAESYLPEISLKTLSKPRLSVVGLGFDDIRLVREPQGELILSVQCALQSKLDGAKIKSNDLTEGDNLVEFLWELYQDCRDDSLVTGKHYSWMQTLALKNEDTGLPYSFANIRETHTFEAYFTAFYKYVT